MILELIVVVLSILPVLWVGVMNARILGVNRWLGVIVQMVIGLLAGAGATVMLPVNPLVIVPITVTPLLANIANSLYNNRQRKKALDGDYGDETKWAAELVDEGDDHFKLAMLGLTNDEKMEIGIIADSKEQLRKRTIERFEEKADERVSEEYVE